MTATIANCHFCAGSARSTGIAPTAKATSRSMMALAVISIALHPAASG